MKRESRPIIATSRCRPFVIFAALLATAWPCGALQVSPTYQVFEGKAGKAVNGSMTVTNNETDPITITPTVKEWFKFGANEAFAVDDWLRLDSTRPFDLKAGESHVVKYRMHVPKQAKGELIGAMTFSNKPEAGMVTMQLSVVQYLAVKGTEDIEADFANVGINISSDTTVGLLVVNKGNVHLRPHGYVNVVDSRHNKAGSFQIVPGQPVFPGQSRVYSSTIKRYRLPAGQYEAVIEMKDVDRPISFPVKRQRFNVLPDGKVEIPEKK